jgi:hypothetical protein
MVITKSQYSSESGVLAFRFDMGATLFWGSGVLPGTDVPTYRFVYSSGFKDNAEYKASHRIARDYVRGLGFDNVQAYFESFQKKD